MKEIASYRHASEPAEQVPDTAPGPYYVSAVDGPRFALVSGPYATHREALDRVAKARQIAELHDTRAVFYSFGTVRMMDRYQRGGRLQQLGYTIDTLEKVEDHELAERAEAWGRESGVRIPARGKRGWERFYQTYIFFTFGKP